MFDADCCANYGMGDAAKCTKTFSFMADEALNHHYSKRKPRKNTVIMRLLRFFLLKNDYCHIIIPPERFLTENPAFVSIWQADELRPPLAQ
jgi:hypothetical protein